MVHYFAGLFYNPFQLLFVTLPCIIKPDNGIKCNSSLNYRLVKEKQNSIVQFIFCIFMIILHVFTEKNNYHGLSSKFGNANQFCDWYFLGQSLTKYVWSCLSMLVYQMIKKHRYKYVDVCINKDYGNCFVSLLYVRKGVGFWEINTPPPPSP